MSATKRYYVGNSGLVQSAQGEWVAYADYLALQAALHEALTAWEAFGCAAAMEPAWPAWDRIRELRAQFLDDK